MNRRKKSSNHFRQLANFYLAKKEQNSLDTAKRAIEGEDSRQPINQHEICKNVPCCTYVRTQQELPNGSSILKWRQNTHACCLLELAKKVKRPFLNFRSKYWMNFSFISWTFIPVGFFVSTANPPKWAMSPSFCTQDSWPVTRFPVRKFIFMPSCKLSRNSLPRTLMFNCSGASSSSSTL